jgi:hypothetical protein
MAPKNNRTLKAAAGVVVAGLVAGAGYGGYQLHRWSANWDRAAEKGAVYGDPGSGVTIAPELLTWHQVGRIGTGLASVKSFAFLKDGSLVVAGERKLRLMSTGGQVLRDIPLQGVPQAVTVMDTPDGTLLFAGMVDHVEVFDTVGTPHGKWPTFGDDAFLTCLSPGAAGKTLWIADAGRRVVDELDLTGKVLREVGRADDATHAPGLVVPSAHLDVAVAGKDGLVWVNNPGRHEMEAYDPQGVMVRQWGQAGPGVGLFSGCCNPTDFFMLGDDRIVTAEKGTPRVAVYTITGDLQSVITADFSPDTAGIDVAGDSSGRVWILDPIAHDLRIYAPNAGGLAGKL